LSAKPFLKTTEKAFDWKRRRGKKEASAEAREVVVIFHLKK